MVDDKTLREHSSMSAFTFYLDDLTKLRVLQRLKALGLDTAKGSISATIRVCLNEFAASTDDSIKDKIEQEYLLTTKKSKRSTL